MSLGRSSDAERPVNGCQRRRVVWEANHPIPTVDITLSLSLTRTLTLTRTGPCFQTWHTLPLTGMLSSCAGAMVNISSGAAYVEGNILYTMSKAALNSMQIALVRFLPPLQLDAI